ncbi:MAG: hypothetical protein K2P86_09755 [Xanthobacteraceae bacterium]|nr:hypothetical protein [Xanthobacteraceae bacterium]
MLKTTLYGAVAGGLLVAATVTTPVIAAPSVPTAPQVEKNATDAQYYYYERRHRRHYNDHDGYYYYGPRHHYYQPGPGIHFRAW